MNNSFNPNEIKQINTPEEARQYAIDWQTWVSDQNLSYAELFTWQEVLTQLATRFNLTEEFQENGII